METGNDEEDINLFGITQSLETEDLKNLSWELLPAARHLLTPRVNCAAVSVWDETIVVCGGRNSSCILSSTEILDVTNMQWAEFVHMNSCRSHCAAVSLDDEIYVFGGMKEEHGRYVALNSVEVLNMDSTNNADTNPPKWEIVPSTMSSARFGCAATAIGPHEIMVAGGHDGVKSLKTVEIWNTILFTWTPVANLVTERYNCGAVKVRNRVYIVGGENKSGPLASVEVYDLERQAWLDQSALALPYPQKSPPIVISSNQLLLIGGHGDDFENTVATFEDVNDGTSSNGMKLTYDIAPCVTKGRSAFAIVRLSDSIYILGGESDGVSLNCIEEMMLPATRISTRTAASLVDDKSQMSLPVWNQAMELERKRFLGELEILQEAAEQTYSMERNSLQSEIAAVERQMKQLTNKFAAKITRVRNQLEDCKHDRDVNMSRLENARSSWLARFNEDIRQGTKKFNQEKDKVTNDQIAPKGDGQEVDVSNENEPGQDIPTELLCSLTGHLMKNPVLAMDGHTYERSAMEAYIEQAKESMTDLVSPVTGETLPLSTLIPNLAIEKQCHAYLKEVLQQEAEYRTDFSKTVGSSFQDPETPSRALPRQDKIIKPVVDEADDSTQQPEQPQDLSASNASVTDSLENTAPQTNKPPEIENDIHHEPHASVANDNNCKVHRESDHPVTPATPDEVLQTQPEESEATKDDWDNVVETTEVQEKSASEMEDMAIENQNPVAFSEHGDPDISIETSQSSNEHTDKEEANTLTALVSDTEEQMEAPQLQQEEEEKQKEEEKEEVDDDDNEDGENLAPPQDDTAEQTKVEENEGDTGSEEQITIDQEQITSNDDSIEKNDLKIKTSIDENNDDDGEATSIDEGHTSEGEENSAEEEEYEVEETATPSCFRGNFFWWGTSS